MRGQSTNFVVALIIAEARSHGGNVLLSGIRQTGRHFVGILAMVLHCRSERLSEVFNVAGR